MLSKNLQWAAPAVLLGTLVITAGCGSSGDSTLSGASGDNSAKTVAAAPDHAHGGWWCVEHGIPEEECSMCSAKAAASFKEKGDWCEEHNRAESQCFKCDPSRAEKFAKLYAAKFGHSPPEPTE